MASNVPQENLDATTPIDGTNRRLSILNCFASPKIYQNDDNILGIQSSATIPDDDNLNNEHQSTSEIHTLKKLATDDLNNISENDVETYCLPKGWEARTDLYGRVFYIDHINRDTTWNRPDCKDSLTQIRRTPTISERDRRVMDQRYQSMRRSIRRQQEAAPYRNMLKILKSPAAIFITRPDFFTLLEKNKNADEMLKSSTLLKHLVTKVRRDILSFIKLQHHRELIDFINKFADSNKNLPEGWEMKNNHEGKIFFIDHNSKSTTFIDPRLPLQTTTRSNAFRVCKEPELQSSLDYEDRLIGLLRQKDIIELIENKIGCSVNFELRSKLNVLRIEGRDALPNFADDVDLLILLSQLEDDINRFSNVNSQKTNNNIRSNNTKGFHQPHFEIKLAEFYQKLENKRYKQGSNKISLVVRRSHIMEDSYEKLMALTGKQLMKSKFSVLFEGEDGLDYGGPSREFFFLLSRELFNPYYGLFEYSADNQYTVQIAPNSLSTSSNALNWFRFAGRIIGLTIVHQFLLDVFFTRPFYKQLLNMRPNLSDLESLDVEFYRSLKYINDGTTNFNELINRQEITYNEHMNIHDGKELTNINEANNNNHIEIADDIGIKNNYDSTNLNSLPSIQLDLNGTLYSDLFDESIASNHVEKEEVKGSQSMPSNQFSRISSTNNSSNAFPSTQANLKTNFEFFDSEPVNFDDLDLTFSVTEEVDGKIVERDLKPNGHKIAVNERNKREYIDLMVNWRVNRNVHSQMNAIIQGFSEVLEVKYLSKFDAQDFEILLAGTIELDIEDWKRNTEYRNGYHTKHLVIMNLWKAIESFDNTQRLRLLQFTTGTSSLPFDGFAGLRGSMGPKKFCVEKWGRITDLPRAHTCFNRLDLPPYTSYDILLEKLTISINESNSYAIE